ncbi:cGMP-gated cation channel alpha-1, partial [Ophiophagus hannah]
MSTRLLKEQLSCPSRASGVARRACYLWCSTSPSNAQQSPLKLRKKKRERKMKEGRKEGRKVERQKEGREGKKKEKEEKREK